MLKDDVIGYSATLQGPAPPATKPRLGHGRVLKPYPLDEIAILGNGGTILPWVQGRYMTMTAAHRIETWAMNSVCFALRVDKAFACYTDEWLKGNIPEGSYPSPSAKGDPPDAIEKLKRNGLFADLVPEYKKTGAEVVTLDGAHDTLEFPLAEVIEETGCGYFVNSHSYMLAFAITCMAMTPGKKKIYHHGCDYDYGHLRNVYEAGKPCGEFWLGFAMARGIEVEVHPLSNLTSYRQMTEWGRYGYGHQQPEVEFVGGRPRLKGFKTLPVAEKTGG